MREWRRSRSAQKLQRKRRPQTLRVTEERLRLSSEIGPRRISPSVFAIIVGVGWTMLFAAFIGFLVWAML